MPASSFFVWRVFLFGPRHRLVVYTAIVLLIGQAAVFAVTTAKGFLVPAFRDFQDYTWLMTLGSTMVVGADFLLTTVLVITLHQSRTGMKRYEPP
ncbi:hypothetical protein C8Q76DRAFT_798528 [Earliella scabrosa]|nr:hypothetical protein C8Q76DRAFT_798528 [Earliella scabrosa]